MKGEEGDEVAGRRGGWIDRIFQSRRKPVHRRQLPRPPSNPHDCIWIPARTARTQTEQSSERVERA